MSKKAKKKLRAFKNRPPEKWAVSNFRSVPLYTDKYAHYSSLPIKSYIGINSYIGPKSGKILIHTQVISHMVDHFSVFNKP